MQKEALPDFSASTKRVQTEKLAKVIFFYCSKLTLVRHVNLSGRILFLWQYLKLFWRLKSHWQSFSSSLITLGQKKQSNFCYAMVYQLFIQQQKRLCTNNLSLHKFQMAC